MSGIHFHLFAASLIAVASFTQAQEMLIKPEDIHRAAVAPAVVELAWSAKQNAVFVSSPDWKDEKKSTVLRLNPQTLETQATISTDVKGFGVALDDENNRLYLTEGFNGSVGIVDTATNRSLGSIKLQEKVNIESAWRKAGMTGEHLDFMLSELKRFKISEGYLYKFREAQFDAGPGVCSCPASVTAWTACFTW